MMVEKYVKKSKFLSWALRHAPEKIGLELDAEGWAEIGRLIECAGRHGVNLSRTLIYEIVETDSKGRYEMSADLGRIRATYGHSIAIELTLEPAEPPRVLYHGTAARFLHSILMHGIRPGRRQFVHLSSGIEMAEAVGARHGQPVILEIAAGEMYQAGIEFFRSASGTWLVRSVPVEYMRVPTIDRE